MGGGGGTENIVLFSFLSQEMVSSPECEEESLLNLPEMDASNSTRGPYPSWRTTADRAKNGQRSAKIRQTDASVSINTEASYDQA